MKLQIRNHTFETNSSSAHSFTLGENPEFLLRDINVQHSYVYDVVTDSIILRGGEYGWGIETLTSWNERANYLLTQTFYKMDTEGLQEKILRIMTEFLGYTVKFIGSNDWEDPNRAYVDHESTDLVDDILFGSDQDIINFIFNKGTTVLIDNDNH